MAKWKSDSALAKRLQIKPGSRARVYNAPENYLALLGDLPEGAQVTDSGDGPFDVVHLFVQNSESLNRDALTAIGALKPGGVLWMSYPKRTSKVETDLTRDRGWEIVEEAGWVGVAQVSVDEVWSATRFRPADEVGK